MSFSLGWLNIVLYERFGLLGRAVDVFSLGHPGKLIFVAIKAAEQDPAPQHQDCCAPAKTVRPRVVIITFIDQLVELDRVDDQSDYLHDYCNERKHCHSMAQQMHNLQHKSKFSYSDPKSIWTLKSYN